MGVLTDYFRAADREAARQVLTERVHGPLAVYPGLPEVDGVEAKGVDTDVVLRSLVAAVPGSDAARADRAPLVWPDESDEEALVEGPWVFEVGDATRDALASVDDAAALDVAQRWSTSDELAGTTGEELRPLVVALAGLARRARAAGERLYCWTSL